MNKKTLIILVFLPVVLPLAFVLLVLLLGFALAISPVALIGFIAYQIRLVLVDRYQSKLRYKYKLQTNKNYIISQKGNFRGNASIRQSGNKE